MYEACSQPDANEFCPQSITKEETVTKVETEQPSPLEGDKMEEGANTTNTPTSLRTIEARTQRSHYLGRLPWRTPKRGKGSTGRSITLTTPDSKDYPNMTVTQLRKICKGRYLIQGRLKDVLIRRIEEDDKGITDIVMMVTNIVMMMMVMIPSYRGHPPPSRL